VQLLFTETLVLHVRVKLILCAFRIAVILLSLYFFITKILLSKAVKLACLAIDILTGWELWNIRLVI